MLELRARIETFLRGPLPPELEPHYAPENMTEMLMGYYLDQGTFDAEACQMLEICASLAADEVDRHQTEEGKRFFRESGAIVEAILAEKCGGWDGSGPFR